MKKKTSGTVSQIDIKRLEKRIRMDAVQKAERERRMYLSVELPVGTHTGCGGVIMYTSHFVADSYRLDTFSGKEDTKREIAQCSCNKCGALFRADFPQYRKKILDYRSGE